MASVDDFLSPYSESVRAMALALRTLVRALIPDTVEIVDTSYKLIEYANADGKRDTLVYIAPFKDSVNLGFFKGTSLPDLDSLLRGTGKNLRHVKFKTGDSTDTPAVRALLAAAWAEDRKGS